MKRCHILFRLSVKGKLELQASCSWSTSVDSVLRKSPTFFMENPLIESVTYFCFSLISVNNLLSTVWAHCCCFYTVRWCIFFSTWYMEAYDFILDRPWQFYETECSLYALSYSLFWVYLRTMTITSMKNMTMTLMKAMTMTSFITSWKAYVLIVILQSVIRKSY